MRNESQKRSGTRVYLDFDFIIRVPPSTGQMSYCVRDRHLNELFRQTTVRIADGGLRFAGRSVRVVVLSDDLGRHCDFGLGSTRAILSAKVWLMRIVCKRANRSSIKEEEDGEFRTTIRHTTHNGAFFQFVRREREQKRSSANRSNPNNHTPFHGSQ
jgi:hypothetical protein